MIRTSAVTLTYLTLPFGIKGQRRRRNGEKVAAVAMTLTKKFVKVTSRACRTGPEAKN